MVNLYAPRPHVGRGFLFNCWKPLKAVRLKHSDEIYTSVNAAKAEKTNSIA